MHDNRVVKVSGKSPVTQTAGSIAKCFEQNKYKESVEIRAIGASSVNQMIKAVIVARSKLTSKGYDLVLRPFFAEEEVDGELRTLIVLEASLI